MFLDSVATMMTTTIMTMTMIIDIQDIIEDRHRQTTGTTIAHPDMTIDPIITGTGHPDPTIDPIIMETGHLINETGIIRPALIINRNLPKRTIAISHQRDEEACVTVLAALDAHAFVTETKPV